MSCATIKVKNDIKKEDCLKVKNDIKKDKGNNALISHNGYGYIELIEGIYFESLKLRKHLVNDALYDII